MTLAYATAKRSRCLQRKVGAVIVGQNNAAENVPPHALPTSEFIASSGCNEVPLGLQPCAFLPGIGQCYRSHLKKIQAASIKHCPGCGKRIKISWVCPHCNHSISSFETVCPNEQCKRPVGVKHYCSKCRSDVFGKFLAGGKEAPGKLLDMCRSLDAEEMALLNLGQHSHARCDELVMYVTTQPCNLCANKIVASGIKRVVYNEPYDMKEAALILSQGGVPIERFEGVRSSAYFRYCQKGV